MHRLFALALAVAVLGIGCTSLEQRLLFHPIPAEYRPLPVDSPIEDIALKTPAGVALHARWCPYPGSKTVVLYCHGNAGNLQVRAREVHDLWEALQASVLIVDYPGFGLSQGTPDEAGCYAAGEAAYDWLTQTRQIAPEEILLYGESLGGGVAVELARRRPHKALILVRTFTSVPDVAQERIWWFPVRGLVSNRFDSLAKIANCKQPTFIASADCDRLVPYDHGRKLKEAAGCQPTFFRLIECGHNDPLPSDFYTALRRFLGIPEPAPKKPAVEE